MTKPIPAPKKWKRIERNKETHTCDTKPVEFYIKGYEGCIWMLIIHPAKYMIEISFCPFCGHKFHNTM